MCNFSQWKIFFYVYKFCLCSVLAFCSIILVEPKVLARWTATMLLLLLLLYVYSLAQQSSLQQSNRGKRYQRKRRQRFYAKLVSDAKWKTKSDMVVPEIKLREFKTEKMKTKKTKLKKSKLKNWISISLNLNFWIFISWIFIF